MQSLSDISEAGKIEKSKSARFLPLAALATTISSAEGHRHEHKHTHNVSVHVYWREKESLRLLFIAWMWIPTLDNVLVIREMTTLKGRAQ